MINFIRRAATTVKGGPGGAGFFLDTARRLITTKGPAPHLTESVVQVRAKAVTALTSATYTVSFPDDDGKVFKLNRSAGITVTLPAVSSANAGMKVTFINAGLPSSNNYRISPAAADNIKYGTDDKDIINSEGSDALGDLVTLVSDGVDGWYVTEQVGTWAKES